MGTGTDDLNLAGQPVEVIERAIAVKRSHGDGLDEARGSRVGGEG